MNLIEDMWYSITWDGETFIALYRGQLEEDMGFVCNICGKPRGRLQDFMTYENEPNENKDNFSGQYFFGSECIKKLLLVQCDNREQI